MAIKTESVSIPLNGTSFPGYFAAPESGSTPGVVVIQEIFGVNNHIRDVTNRFAEAGYSAVAPDLFWHVKPGIELGYTPDDIAKGRDIRGQIGDDDALADVQAAMDYLKGRPECSGKLGIVGYCWGGYVVFMAAANLQLNAASAYYGGGITGKLAEAAKITLPTLFHFGDQDTSIPMDQVQQIQEAFAGKSNATVHVYPGAQHGFHCNERGSFNPDSSKQAMARTLEHFGQHLQ